MHEQLGSDQHRPCFIAKLFAAFSQQFEMLDEKKGVSPRLSKKPSAPCLDASILCRLSLALIARCPRLGTKVSLYQPQRLFKGERGEGLTADRQGTFKAGQPIGKCGVTGQVFRTEGTEQEYRKVRCCPASADILQYVERRRICPLRIIDEKDDRRAPRQGVSETRDCLEQASASLCFIERKWSGQIWHLITKFRQQAGQFGQPGITEQCLE